MTVHAAEIDDEARGARPPEALLRKDLDTALRRVDREPEDAAAWQDVGRIRTLLRMDHDAVTAFERALALDPRMDDVFWLALAIAATRSGRYDFSLRAFDALTRLFPGEPAYWIFKSMALENLGRPDESEAALREAADLDASRPENLVAIAFALGLLGRHEEALALDEQAIAQNDRNAYAWANKGVHLAKLGRGDEADVAFRRAVALAPRVPTILRNYGVALGDLGRYDEAKDRLEEALALNQEDVAALRSLGFVLTKLGDDRTALEKDAKAVELAPHHPVAWRSKGVDLFHLERYEEALFAFSRATELAPGRADMWQAKGSALWKLGQYEAAADAFEHASTCDGTAPDAWLGRGASLDALGRHAEALEALRTAVGLAPERPELWAMLGRTYRQLGNARGAEQAFRRGLELEPSITMRSGFVDALAAQGREQEALALLADRPAADQDEALVAYLRGVILARLGRDDEAIGELSVAVRRWRLDGVSDARALAAGRAVAAYRDARQGAASWSDHWFGARSGRTTRLLGAILFLGLLGALAVPLAVPDSIGALAYGVGWAAITLPVTVLLLLLALPTVQTIKAGGGSFEITTIVLPERDHLALALPSEIRLEKIADLPSLDAGQALGLGDLVPALLEVGSPEEDGGP